MFKIKRIPLYTLLLVVILVTIQISSSAEADGAEQSAATSGKNLAPLSHPSPEQIKQWVQTIAEQPEFRSWQGAITSLVPIGPGQHGWLVTVYVKKQPVGYLIVNAKEDGGYTLGEYGAGSHPLFDPNTLYKSLIRQNLIPSYEYATKKPLKLERLYAHPLLAVWRWQAPNGETHYLDGWTGESLPINDKIWQAAAAQLQAGSSKKNDLPSLGGTTATHISKTLALPSFDVYERMPWLTGSPLTQLASLTTLLERKQNIRYTAELYDGSVLFVWPAIGYQRWDTSDLFIAFEQNGSRYISLPSLTDNGHFFN